MATTVRAASPFHQRTEHQRKGHWKADLYIRKLSASTLRMVGLVLDCNTSPMSVTRLVHQAVGSLQQIPRMLSGKSCLKVSMLGICCHVKRRRSRWDGRRQKGLFYD